MSFSPEDIANRVFTPSAEGYHQGEVRDFLQRVAREVRSLHAAYTAQSDGAGHLVPLPGSEASFSAAANNTPESERLAAISDRLETLVAQLEGRLVNPIAPEQPQAYQPQAKPAEPERSAHVDQPVIDQPPIYQRQSASDLPASTPQFAMPAAAPHAAAPAPPPTSAAVPVARPATIAPVAQPAPTSRDIAASNSGNAPGDPTFIERVPIAVEDAPPSSAESFLSSATPVPRVPSEKLTAPIGGLTPDDPMFSDSANDLLDGVLDDVMGSFGDD